MPHLYAVYLGGRISGCRIEQHDIRFVVGDSIDDTLPALREQWIGLKSGLHLDAYMEVREVDGYEVSLSREPSTDPERLFFVNCGGYDPERFMELHDAGLFVTVDDAEAKARAKEVLLVSSRSQHKDDLFDVDDCIAIKSVAGFHVHLRHIGSAWRPLIPDWFGYRRIDRDGE
jgi:hypothetical protein